ncbi:MAG: NADH-quinone oxidoreductase subunit C [Acidobacteria bacterium]|nr:NADH-quinone oxidoreductase subunit C [Acidobacteriota bacterium]
MGADDVLHVLQGALPGSALADATGPDGMPAILVERDDVLRVLQTLRDHPALQFAFFADVTAADYHPATPRFEVVYLLACLGAAYATGQPAPARRLRVKVRVAAEDPRIASATSVYPAAGWPEREVFDLFGIAFDGHPDLRRILTPDGWEGHPLRKDYPVQIRKDAERWSPLQLTAEEFAENMRADRERATRQATNVRPPRAD